MNTLKRVLPALVAVASLLLGIAGVAQAASLTYSANTNVTLTSGILVIDAGSTADSVANNATSVVVGVSGAETFVATSASADIDLLTNSSTGSITATVSCGAGNLSQLTITSSAGASGNYTVTLGTAFSCNGGNSQSGGGGGGGGGSYSVATPAIASFTASPVTISAGQSSTLSWSVSGATSISISPTVGSEPASATGSVVVKPTATTTYTLTAAGSGSPATAQVTVTVSGTTAVNSPTPTPTPTAGGSASASASAPSGAHPDGTLVINSAGTVYLIKNGELYGFRSAAEYATWGFTFSQVVKENSVDATLPLGGILKAADGSLVLDSSDKRTVYIVDGGQKMGFVSYKVFVGLGYAKSKKFNLNLSDYPAGSPVSSASAAHPAGSLVRSGATIYQVTSGGQLAPFTSMAVFSSYGYSTSQVVAANAADLALPHSSPVLLRDGTLVSSSGSYYVVSDGQVRPFSSLANMVAAGYSAKNVVPVANLGSYAIGTQAF